MDPHWRPIWRHCNLCQIQYDYILKVEGFPDEEGRFVDVLRPGVILNHQLNLNQNKEYTSMSSKEITEMYLQQLNNEEVLALHKVYENDFKLFGYE